jgi:flavin-dependent dehydrogenase
VRYGAKALPVTGLYAQPKLYCDGAMLVGDSASMCNAFRLSGIHLAMKSGSASALPSRISWRRIVMRGWRCSGA